MRSKTALLFALPLALLLAGCSLISGGSVKDQPQASRLLYVSQSTTNAVLAVDIESKSPYGDPITGFSGPGNMVAFGDHLYVVNQNGNSVSDVNRKTNRTERSFNTGKSPWGIAVTQDGKYLYVTNSGDGTVSRIYLPTGAAEIIDVTYVNGGQKLNLRPMGVAAVKISNNYYAYVSNELSKPTTDVNASPTGILNTLENSTLKTTTEITGAVSLRNLALGLYNASGIPTKLFATDYGKGAFYHFLITTPDTPAPQTQATINRLSDAVAGPAGSKNVNYVFACYRDNSKRSDGNTVGGLTIREASSLSQAGSADPSIVGGLSPSALAISSDGCTLFIAAGSNVLWMDVSNYASPRDSIVLKVSDRQEYQNASPTGIALAGGVPNQK